MPSLIAMSASKPAFYDICTHGCGSDLAALVCMLCGVGLQTGIGSRWSLQLDHEAPSSPPCQVSSWGKLTRAP